MSYYSLIEELKSFREDNEFFESLRESTNTDIFEDEDLINESLDEFEEIDEAKVVTFDGQTFPKFGHAVILCGGAGSGKSFARGTKIAIDAKVFDVDRLKELYMAAQKMGKIKSDVKKYDLGNPDDVTALHNKIKALGYKDKQEEAFFKGAVNGTLPNVIYDITGDDPNKLEKLGSKLKGLGYKVTLVWVVTNRQVAMIQNLSRDRIVSQKIFHEIHNAVNKTVFPFLKNKAKDYDAAWIIFGSELPANALSADEKKQLENVGAIKLEKKGSGFEIPDEIAMIVYNILGPNEENPDAPQTYKDFDDIRTGERKGRDFRDFELNKVKSGVDSLLKKTEK